MATHRSSALTGSQQPRFVRHVPDRVEGTCPHCDTTSLYVQGNGRLEPSRGSKVRPSTFVLTGTSGRLSRSVHPRD